VEDSAEAMALVSTAPPWTRKSTMKKKTSSKKASTRSSSRTHGTSREFGDCQPSKVSSQLWKKTSTSQSWPTANPLPHSTSILLTTNFQSEETLKSHLTM
jgi:hypothetical protein